MLKDKSNRDYLLTFITEFTILITGVLVYRMAHQHFGEIGFSHYSVSRRTASFIMPLLFGGLSVGIPRYVAFAVNDVKMKLPASYFISGSILALLVTVPSLLIFTFFASFFSNLFFDSKEFAFIIPAISMMILGMVLHTLVYGYYRGKMQMEKANVLQFINLGLTPMIAFYCTDKIENVLFLTGASWSTLSFVVLIYLVATEKWKTFECRECFSELFNYGMQRVPGDVAIAGFLALPTYFAAHMVSDNLQTAGYVAFGMALLNMSGAAFGPICLILLPKASEIIVKKDYESLRVNVKRITLLTLGLTCAGIIAVELFASSLLKIYLSSPVPDLAFCIRTIIPAALGFTLYISLRSVLDAYYLKPVNTKNIFIAFSFFIVCSAAIMKIRIGSTYIEMLYAFVTAMLLLGWLTYSGTNKILKERDALS